MGDLQATVEFLVELHKFYNVDLFIRGNYQFRLTFKPPKCAHAIQVETCDYKDKAGAFTLFPAFITEDGQTAVSRTFNIYYKDEEVILKDVFLFRVHLLIDSTKAADCIDKTVLELNVDVHFTEQILRKENYQSLPMVTSRTLQFHMSCFDGLHHQVPLLFDYYYFSIVDVVFHATIVSLGLPNWRILKPVKSGWFAKSNPQRTPSPIFFNTLFGNRQLNTQFYSDTALKYAMPTSTMTRESFEKASGMHRNLCAILAMAHYQLLNYFEEMMKHVDNKQKISLGSKLDPAELVDGLCKKLQTLQSCEEAFDEICSDLSVLTNELALLWLQFQESFALNDKIRSILQEQHHQERMKHFSEAFFLHQLSWSSLVQPSDGSAQKHTAMGQCVKNSRYLSLIPPVTVECAEVDGDLTTTPIFFEDRYVSGNDVKIDKQALNVTQPVTTLVEDEVLEHKPLSFGILNEAFRDGSPTKGHRDSEEWVDITMEDSQANVVVEDDHQGACQDLQDAGIVSGTGNCVTDGTTVAGNSGEDPIKDVLPDILCAEASNVDGMGDLNSGSTTNKDIVMPCTMADQETDHLTACVANDVRITTPFSAGTSQISVSEETNNHKGDQNGTTAGNPPCVMVGSKESADNTHSTNSKSTNLSPELTPVSTCVESDNESGTNSCLVAKQTLENPNGEDDECCIMALTISDSKEIEETAKTSDSQATQKSSEISETNEVNQSDSNFAKNEQKKENYVVACAKEVDDVPEIAVAVSVTDATSIVTEVKSKDVATDSGFPTKEQLINSGGDESGQSTPSSAGNDIGSAGEDGSENTKVVPCSLVANDEEPATVTMVENIVEPDSTTIVAAEVVQLSSEDGRPSSAKDVDLDSPPSGTKEFEKCQNLGPDSEENPSGLKPVIAAEEATTGEKQIVSSTKTVKVTYIPEAEPEKLSDRSYTLERKIDNSVFYDRSGACQLPPIRGKTGTQWFDEIDRQRLVNVPHPAKTVEKPTTCFCGDNTDKGASPYKSDKEVEKRNIKLDRAKQEVKSRMNYCGTLYSDLDLEPLVRPYFMDNKPDLSSAPVHFVICVHGLDGNSGDLRLLRCFLEMALPSTKFEFLMSEINQDNTFLPFHDLTEKLVSEILHHMEAYRVTPTRISFIGHSLGNIIIRSALTHPLMEPYINMFHTFLSLSGPHLGMIYHTSSLVSTGLWLMQKWKKSASLSELSLNDSQDLRETFLYKLSQKKGLEYFTNVLLVSSVQDHYVPFHSSRIEMPKSLLRGNSQECAVYREMMDNILQPLLSKPNRTLVRYSVYHCLPSSTNTFIGRAAHIAMLDSELFIEKLICRSAAKYFK